MGKSILTNEYSLVREWALKQDYTYNSKITGLSLTGLVMDVLENRIKVNFSSDFFGKNSSFEEFKEKAYWFEYSSTFTSDNNRGWYFMPEIGDRVLVYFPSGREFEGVAIHSLQNSKPIYSRDSKEDWEKAEPFALERNRWTDPAIKSLKTRHDKEIIFAPDRIIIQSDGVYITLNDNDGVEIYTVNSVDIISEERITLKAAEVVIKGEEKVTINGEKIKISGSSVKIN